MKFHWKGTESEKLKWSSTQFDPIRQKYTTIDSSHIFIQSREKIAQRSANKRTQLSTLSKNSELSISTNESKHIHDQIKIMSNLCI